MHDMGPISCHIYFVTTWSRGEELPHYGTRNATKVSRVNAILAD